MASIPGAQPPAPTAPVKIVQTAETLQQAVMSGEQDIEIRAHLDLRDLSRLPNPALESSFTTTPIEQSLLYITDSMRSMRVRPIPSPTARM